MILKFLFIILIFSSSAFVASCRTNKDANEDTKKNINEGEAKEAQTEEQQTKETSGDVKVYGYVPGSAEFFEYECTDVNSASNKKTYIRLQRLKADVVADDYFYLYGSLSSKPMPMTKDRPKSDEASKTKTFKYHDDHHTFITTYDSSSGSAVITYALTDLDTGAKYKCEKTDEYIYYNYICNDGSSITELGHNYNMERIPADVEEFVIVNGFQYPRTENEDIVQYTDPKEGIITYKVTEHRNSFNGSLEFYRDAEKLENPYKVCDRSSEEK